MHASPIVDALLVELCFVKLHQLQPLSTRQPSATPDLCDDCLSAWPQLRRPRLWLIEMSMSKIQGEVVACWLPSSRVSASVVVILRDGGKARRPVGASGQYAERTCPLSLFLSIKRFLILCFRLLPLRNSVDSCEYFF